jgi:hypothetical protein
MGGFDKKYDLSKPAGSDFASDLDTIIKNGSKGATAERYGLEHVPLDSAATGAEDKNNTNAQGRHLPGMVSVLLSDTTVNITAFVTANQPPNGTGIGTGSIALDTTKGQLQRFNGAAFVNLGLSSTIYTAGDGILLVAEEFAIDPADADDMLEGTSLAKVVTPAMAKWSFGSTEYLEAKQIQDSGVAETIGATPEFERYFPNLAINTIIGASFPSSFQFQLPVGEFLISCMTPLHATGVALTKSHTYLYNETSSTTQLDLGGKELTSPGMVCAIAQNNTLAATIQGTFSLGTVSTFSVRCNNGAKGIAISSGNQETYSTLQIWKKKVVVI